MDVRSDCLLACLDGVAALLMDSWVAVVATVVTLADPALDDGSVYIPDFTSSSRSSCALTRSVRSSAEPNFPSNSLEWEIGHGEKDNNDDDCDDDYDDEDDER